MTSDSDHNFVLEDMVKECKKLLAYNQLSFLHRGTSSDDPLGRSEVLNLQMIYGTLKQSATAS